MFGKRSIYLDFAAGVSGNPSSPHEEGRAAKRTLEDARRAIARLVEVQSDDVIFTGGATEANALAILGSTRAAKARGVRAHALFLPGAHASIIENMKLAASEGADIDALPIQGAKVHSEELRKKVRPETVCIAMEAVCGETGVIWNTREVRTFLDTLGPTRPYLHVDASQAPLTEKITRAHFGADMLAFDASKVGKTRGIGALVAHRTIPLAPLFGGGGQERGLSPGSEAPELARAFAFALGEASQGRETFRAQALGDRARLVGKITKRIPNILINEGHAQAPHILNLSLPERDTDYLVALLNEAGFMVSSRSACETDSEEGSRAVFTLFGDASRAKATIRVSWGPSVRSRDLDRFADALIEATAFIDSGKRR